MPYVGDELHHFGWQTCSSSNGTCGLERRHLILPGFRSSRVHILDVKSDPRSPQIAKVIEPKELIQKTGYSRPHTVHCLPGGIVVMSMLGDAQGNAPGGLAVLDAKTFDVLGRWEKEKGPQALAYDFWYQPRHNVLVTSEFVAPNTYENGFNLDDVKAGKYGQRLHVWDLKKCSHLQAIDFGADGLVPLDIRGLHDPAKAGGYVAAALPRDPAAQRRSDQRDLGVDRGSRRRSQDRRRRSSGRRSQKRRRPRLWLRRMPRSSKEEEDLRVHSATADHSSPDTRTDLKRLA